MKRWPSHASFGPLKGRTGQAFWVLLSKKTQNFGRLLKSASVMGKSSSFRAHIHIQKRREGERGGEAEAAFTWRSCTQLTDRKKEGRKEKKREGGGKKRCPLWSGKRGRGEGRQLMSTAASARASRETKTNRSTGFFVGFRRTQPVNPYKLKLKLFVIFC
jgi:hypothetical protein